MAESRVKKSLLNAKVNLIFYVLTLALSFFSRKIFLDCLGADFVGLTGTLQNLLGFLNLAELGIGSAIGYVLYKPLFEENHQQINEIISVFSYLYRWIGWIILALGSILACFLPLIFPDTGFELGVIYAAYFAFLASSLIGYFINYKQTLLGADQKNYVITGYFQSTNIIKILIQMTSAWYTGSYYLWVAIEFTFGIIYSFVLNWRIRITYPWLLHNTNTGYSLLYQYKYIIKKIKQLMIHKFAVFSQYQTLPFIVYAFSNLNISAMLGNYTLITDKVSIFLGNFLSSTSAGVGNLIAEENKEKILSVYWELYTLRIIIAGTVCFALWKLITPFIILWLGKEYILSNSIVAIIIAKIYIGIERGTTTDFLFGYGLFWDIWAPITEAIISVGGAILGGIFFGITGILLGSLLSLILIIEIWKPIMLFRWGFKIPVSQYWRRYFLHISVISLAWIISEKISDFFYLNIGISYYSWIVSAIILTLLYLFLAILLLICISSTTRSTILKLIKRIIKI
ncbi:sugar transporter [uncultured Akkermansia sp.]|uniref:sugar transporter n=1 Tax=uncultured Akkermansia sp. TaxID=512294 RepID=UPI0025D723CD|nr:sugar transporter [uncultured Akkermansia sp.]